MNNFWDLVVFEYKKILYKRTVIIGLILCLIMIIFSTLGIILGSEYVDGKAVRSSYDGVMMDIANARSLTGRELDTELIKEARQAYGMLPVDEPRYTTTEEYTTYARKYNLMYTILKRTFSNTGTYSVFDYTDMQNITDEEIESFYNKRLELKKAAILKKTSLNDKSKAKLLAMNEEVKTPFILGNTTGYERYLGLIYTTGLLAGFLIIISMTPIFSDEYKSAAAIILASKNGKKSLVNAKLFTGLTLSVAICLAFCLLTYVLCMVIYGADGARLPIQLLSLGSVYSINFGTMAVIVTITTTFSCVLLGALTMLLSSKMKSSIGIIAIMSMLLFVPMFISINENIGLLHRIVMLLPSNMMTYWNANSEMLFEIFSLSIEPYIFTPIFAGLVSIAVIPFTYRAFNHYQAS